MTAPAPRNGKPDNPSGALWLSLALLVALGCSPSAAGRPGLRLSGEVVSAPVTDWSFTDNAGLIQLQTKTRYLLPHSVTVVCFRHAGDLYVPSRGAEEKFWVSNVLRDPDVRLRISGRIYPVRAERATGDHSQLLEAIAKKYPDIGRNEESARGLWFFRMTSRS